MSATQPIGWIRDADQGVTWPDPESVGDLEWRLRYAPGTPLTREEELSVASVLDAYRELARRVRENPRSSNTRSACLALRNGKPVGRSPAAPADPAASHAKGETP